MILSRCNTISPVFLHHLFHHKLTGNFHCTNTVWSYVVPQQTDRSRHIRDLCHLLFTDFFNLVTSQVLFLFSKEQSSPMACSHLNLSRSHMKTEVRQYSFIGKKFAEISTCRTVAVVTGACGNSIYVPTSASTLPLFSPSILPIMSSRTISSFLALSTFFFFATAYTLLHG